MSIPAPAVGELDPSIRLLLGPGPSPVHPRVYRAMTTPLLGHLDPEFLGIMNEVQAQLRFVFQTTNPFTIAVSGTGSAGGLSPGRGGLHRGRSTLARRAVGVGEVAEEVLEHGRGPPIRLA